MGILITPRGQKYEGEFSISPIKAKLRGENIELKLRTGVTPNAYIYLLPREIDEINRVIAQQK